MYWEVVNYIILWENMWRHRMWYLFLQLSAFLFLMGIILYPETSRCSRWVCCQCCWFYLDFIWKTWKVEDGTLQRLHVLYGCRSCFIPHFMWGILCVCFWELWFWRGWSVMWYFVNSHGCERGAKIFFNIGKNIYVICYYLFYLCCPLCTSIYQLSKVLEVESGRMC